MIYSWMIALCWLVFLIYWVVSAFSAKRNLRANYRSLFLIRVAMVVVAVATVSYLNSSGVHVNTAYHPNDLFGSIGVVVTAVGVGFAIWARMHLASNWGMPMSVKENPELVTSGPYTHVRHPIYTGVLLAMLGSAFVTGPVWAIVLLFGCAYFVYSAIQEERQMLKEFPDQYPEYRRHTKMLIPYIY